MNRWIEPKCAVPLFLLDNEADAKRCGKINGFVVAFILSIVIVIFAFYWFRQSGFDLYLYVLGVVVVLLLIWLIVPYLAAWINVLNWRGRVAQVEQYEKQGFSQKETIDKMQSLHQTNVQANAITNAAYYLGWALLSRR